MAASKEMIEYLNNHFCYEVDEIYSSSYLVTSISKREHKIKPNYPAFYAALMNIGIEHTLLHSRVLYEFYYKPKVNDYPRATDYVINFKPEIKAHLNEDFYKKVCNQISHLGNARFIEPEKREWDLYEISKELIEITIQFLDALKVADSSCFEEKLNVLRERLNYPIGNSVDLFSWSSVATTTVANQEGEGATTTSYSRISTFTLDTQTSKDPEG